MALFKITCDTCQTSLNVRQKSAIGQILACPKCGSMVQVQPPEGWDQTDPPDPQAKSTKPFVKPVPDPNLPETVSTISGSVSEGLSKPVAPPASQPDNRWQGDEESSSREAGNQSPTESAATQPLLPGDQWNSSQSKQRKKLLFAMTTAVSILIFGIGAIVFAALQLSGDGGDERTAENPKSGKSLSKPAEKNKGAETDKGGKTGEPSRAAEKKNNSQPQKAPSKAGKGKSNKEIPPEKKGEEPGVSVQPPEKPKKDLSDPTKPKTAPEQPKDKSDEKSPPGFEAGDDTVDEAGLPDFFRELDEFSSLFEQDEPLLKLREAFQENDLPGVYGLTRFFVARSMKKTPDPKQALAVNIAGISFKQITLLEFLDFHYQLTAIPVSVDVTPILLAGIEIDQKFDLLVQEKTLREVLEAVADSLGLELVEGNHGLVLTIRNRETQVEQEYPVADIASTAEDRQKLIDQIEILVNRKTWSQVGGVGVITANDEKQSIVVKHFGWAQVRVAEILRHIRKLQSTPIRNENANFPACQHRLRLAKQAKSKSLTLLESEPISLSQLFARIAKENDLHIFVNWEATGDLLLPSGHLPLTVEEENFEQFITELAAGTRLRLVWHSRNVVEMTTDLGASSNLTFESYDLAGATSNRFPSEKLLEAMRNLLASNNLADFEKAELEIDQLGSNAIFAVLPQSAHQNVLKILDTARSVSAE
ncbi:MAG: hypothetical protein VX768_06335 [Planctomycetota bacterium]|nr:hypothetical protein [Planctomycetota bacterium]